MDDKYIFGSVAVLGISAIECVALICGHDGALMSLTVGAISSICAGLIGYTAGKTSN